VRIAEDIADLGADSADEAGLGQVAKWVLERQIPLETSPSSNLQTGAVAAWGTDMSHHPFDRLYRLGFVVTVNTDNRLMSSTTLTKELWLLAVAFGYGLDDLLAFQLNAAAGSFMSFDAKDTVIDALVRAYSAL
jgi:adenosine deaminase